MDSGSNLTNVICRLSRARDLDSIMRIVQNAVRNYTDADGVAFILRENEQCYYADEEAIQPLWKGCRFPLSQCISGWAMVHKEVVVIKDIFLDNRISHDTYHNTFVKSLLMVPIRNEQPLGAIGVYWANEHHSTPEEQNYVQTIADTTAVSIENVRVNSQLKQQIAELSDECRRLEGIIERTRAGTWEWNAQTDEIKIDDVWTQFVGYEDMVAATTDAIIGCDMSGMIVLFNRGAEKLFGCDARSGIGTQVTRFFPESRCHEQADLLQSAREKRCVGPVETECVTVDGTVVSVEIIMLTHRNEADTSAGFMMILRDITERKKTEQELRLLEFSMENASVAVFRMTPEGKFLYANKRARQSLGLKQNESTETMVADADPNFPQELRNAHWQKLKEQGSLTFETQHRSKDGSVLSVEVTDHYFRYGSQEYEFAFAMDITDRKRTEKALRESERDMKRAQSIAHVGSWRIDLNTSVVTASDETRTIYGFTDEILTLKLIQTVPLPEHRARLDAELLNLIQRGCPYNIEFEIRRPSDNAKRYIHSVAEYDSEQKIIFGTFQDITEQKLAEKARWESENRFRLFVENANDIVYALSPDGVFTYVSPNWCDYMGEPPENAIGKSFEPYVHPDDVVGCRCFFEKIVTTREKQSGVEYRVRHADGSWRWHVSNGAPILDNSGGCTGYIGISRDITGQKQMLETLREHEALLQAAIDNSYAGIAIADAPDGKLRYVNDAALRIRGKSRDEVVKGIGIQEYVESWQIFHCDGTPFKDSEVPLARAIMYGEACSKELVVRRDNGEDRIVWANAAPIYGSNGNVTAGIVIFLDTTETKRLNERLRQAEKMESIGTLAGGIAHDFNNILGGIIGFADISLDDVLPESRLAKNLHRILEGGDRAKKLVYQILNFSRRGNEDRTPQYLRPVIEEVVDLLRASLPSSIQIHCDLAQDTRPVLANTTQIHEVVMNLCTNAAHAMKDEMGFLEVIYEETVTEVKIQGRAGTVSPGMYSVITVKDNGCGMNTVTLERIFEPFFTTKTQGEGTGMGMAVLFGIVQRHGGTVTIESEPGNGTCVRVYFPKYPEVTTFIENDSDKPLEHGTERILFIDDEKVIAEMAEDLLISLGYTVSVYNDPILALNVFRSAPDSFDLVITDQTMPSLPGMELVREIRNVKSDIPIILCTGYSKLVDEEKALTSGINGFLCKPFRHYVLAHKIRQVLQQKEINNA